METNKDFYRQKHAMSRLPIRVGEKFIHEGKIKLCKSGFHFCKKWRCFDYYVFNPTNRVFEIEYGDAIGDEVQMVTDSIVFPREPTYLEY